MLIKDVEARAVPSSPISSARMSGFARRMTFNKAVAIHLASRSRALSVADDQIVPNSLRHPIRRRRIYVCEHNDGVFAFRKKGKEGACPRTSAAVPEPLRPLDMSFHEAVSI